MKIHHTDIPGEHTTEIYMDKYELYRLAQALLQCEIRGGLIEIMVDNGLPIIFDWQTRTKHSGAVRLKLFRKENP